MLRSLPSAIDDALDTLYEPNAVFSQFLWSASITFFLVFSFPSFLFLSFLAFLVFFFSFLSCFVSSFFVSLSSLFFPFLSFILFSFLCFFSPIDLRLSCVCVVIDTTCNIYVVVLGGERYSRFSRREQ